MQAKKSFSLSSSILPSLSVTAAVMAGVALPARAQTVSWQIDSVHSSAQFSVRHMMVSNVKGQFTGIAGRLELDSKDITRSRLEANIEAASIDTREPKRDAHLKSADFFDVAKYPTVAFKSKKVVKGIDGRLRVVGDLTIRGKTKEVVLEVDGPSSEIKDPYGNARMGASATTKVHRKDFGILWNGTLETGGVLIGDEVTITIDVEFIKTPVERAGLSDH